jgi:hypothetical protein
VHSSKQGSALRSNEGLALTLKQTTKLKSQTNLPSLEIMERKNRNAERSIHVGYIFNQSLFSPSFFQCV